LLAAIAICTFALIGSAWLIWQRKAAEAPAASGPENIASSENLSNTQRAIAPRSAVDPVAATKNEIDSLKRELVDVVGKLVQDYPESSDAIGLLGMAYNRCHEEIKAQGCWQRAIQRDPNRLDLYIAMASLANRRGEYEQAEEVCRKGLARSPAAADLNCQLAVSLQGSGKLEEAVAPLQQAIAAAPNNGWPYYLLGVSYAQIKDYEKARVNYEMAVKLQPDSFAAQYGLATTYAQLGLEEAAQKSMEQYKKLNAADMGQQRRIRGTSFDVMDFRRSLAATCNEAAAVYLASGALAKAESCSRRAIQAFPENPDCHFLMAKICAGQQRLAEARQAARRAVDLAPDNEEYRRILARLEGKN